MEIYTKESLIARLREIREMGWIADRRTNNVGGIGNTLEDLLGIQENNLPIPNAAEWELKCQRANTSSLLTLFHMEPSPRSFRWVPAILLRKYGWPHATLNEYSFRQTITGTVRSDRGFKVVVDREARKIMISFDSNAVDSRHEEWKSSVLRRVGNLSELDPQPYWGFDDVFHKAGTKLHNCFYILADAKREDGKQYFAYNKIMMLKKFDLDGFLDGIEKGHIYVDFDARTGHNHGTKFRIRHSAFPLLYDEAVEI
ncbi:MAG: MvaI/BcnI restriction endonuclease family protein [SAR324 cluster bacterium]|uniref:MvaI/BcnI restriction endonuclease family protein n=1 Tax=SAR324 cluster bacterium TaxID=2024889 RepID=A0A7X9FRD5_9DELT|nr:MvaI/BcnI restriction endonuclease family protein [SAR324 cluster bacterium]